MNECHFMLTSTLFFSGGDCRSLSNGMEKKNKQDPLNLPAYGLQKRRVKHCDLFSYFSLFLRSCNKNYTIIIVIMNIVEKGLSPPTQFALW